MISRQKLLALAGAGALALAPLTEASAQGNSYCDGRVQAASFYSTTQATPTRSTISYYVIIQSTVGESLAIEVTFRDRRNIVIGGGNGPMGQRLAPWGTSYPFHLGTATLGNPSGEGGLSVPNDLAAGTRVTCRVVVRSGA